MAEEILFDFDWQLDEGALKVRGSIYDEHISSKLMHASRVALSSGEIMRYPKRAGKRILDIPLRCLAHPHPKSEFEWFQLVVDFSGNEGVLIKDLAPLEIVGADPVKQTVKYGGSLKFEVSSIKLGPSVTYEKAEESLIYYPEIIGAGVEQVIASWNFASKTELHFDRELRILLEVPAAMQQLHIRFTAAGEVRSKSFVGLLPLVARREFVFDFTEQQRF